MLGSDNLIFISIPTNKLPEQKQAKAAHLTPLSHLWMRRILFIWRSGGESDLLRRECLGRLGGRRLRFRGGRLTGACGGLKAGQEIPDLAVEILQLVDRLD